LPDLVGELCAEGGLFTLLHGLCVLLVLRTTLIYSFWETEKEGGIYSYTKMALVFKHGKFTIKNV
jgi:hypothetical protein